MNKTPKTSSELYYLLSAQVKLDFNLRKVDFNELEKDLPTVMGDNLKRIRSLLKWSQKEAAAALGVSLSQYKKFEAGREIMRMVTAARWTVVTGISFHQLFYKSRLPLDWDQHRIHEYMAQLQPMVNDLTEDQFTSWFHLVTTLLGLDVKYDNTSYTHTSKEKALADLETYYSFVATGITTFRAITSLTQETLADYLSVHLSTVQGYESKDSQNFSVIMATRFYLATGVNPLWLVAGTNFFYYRKLQSARVDALTAIAEQISPGQFRQIMELARSTLLLTSENPNIAINQ